MEKIYKVKSKKNMHGTGQWPKALFVVMAAVGCACIWLLKHLAVHNFIVVIIPIIFLFVYCGLAWKTQLFYIREDQIGDNAYYMGFLFTLASLAYALLKFQTDHDAMGGSNPSDIIGSFGVALWSTIFGIILRVFFSQIRQDPQDIEREARAKIAHAANVLTGDLSQASLSFNTYTRGLHQAVEEAFQQTKSASDLAVQSIESLSHKLESVEAPDAIINRKIDSIFGNLEKATEKLNEVASSQVTAITGLTSVSSHLIANLDDLNSRINNSRSVVGVVDETQKSILSISSYLITLQDEITKLVNGFGSLQSTQGDMVGHITEHANALSEQLARSRDYTQQTHEALTSMAKLVEDRLS